MAFNRMDRGARRTNFAFPQESTRERATLDETSPFRNGWSAEQQAREVPVREYKTRPGFGIFERETLRTFWAGSGAVDSTVQRWVKNKFVIRIACQHWAPNAQDCRFGCEKKEREAAA